MSERDQCANWFGLSVPWLVALGATAGGVFVVVMRAVYVVFELH